MKILQKVGKKKHFYLADGKEVDKIAPIIGQGNIISLVGGGGKTSTMLELGMEYAQDHHSVIMTTTTKIRSFANDLPKNLRCIGVEESSGKLSGLAKPDELKNLCDYLIIEADGSKGLPLKMPAEHEPVITEGTDIVIAVIGLKAIGQPIQSVCHRWERVADFLGKSGEEFVTVEDVCKILLSPMGLSKNVENRSFSVVLNQADTKEEMENGRKIASLLPDSVPCVLSCYEESEILNI